MRRLALFGVTVTCPFTLLKDLELNLKKVPIGQVMVTLRTITNGWATSSRYRSRETVLLPCVFGCNAIHPVRLVAHAMDSVAHYLECPCLGRLMEEIMGDSYPVSVLSKLCLSPGANCQWAWISHNMYHFIKMSRYEMAKLASNARIAAILRDDALRFGRAT